MNPYRRLAILAASLTVLCLCIAGAPRDYATRKAQRLAVSDHPACMVCGQTRVHGWRCEGHHIVPFHLAPERSADPQNFVVACRSCHFLLHGCNWASSDTNAVEKIHAIRRAAGVE